MYRKTYAKIDLETLSNNIKEIINNYKYKYYFGVVKANAYGHGDYIVNTLIKSGINYLAVSSLEEAISIRKYNKKIPILCLEPISLEYLKEIIENQVTITIESLSYAKELSNKNISNKLKVHLKIDTGMNRLGYKDSHDVYESINQLKNNKNIFVEGIYTHFGTSGINDKYYEQAISNFEKITSEINLKDIPIVHLDRSITLVHHPKIKCATGIRLGIIMYGFNNSLNTPTGLRKLKRRLLLKKLKISDSIMKNNLKLKTAFSLYSEVMSLRTINKNEYVGYGANYIAKEEEIIATIPVGYNDGIPQNIKNVAINNKIYKVVGEVCMDMILVKVDKSIKIHDKVEIFGNNISIKELSKETNSNAYHILTGVTNRVPRVYSDDTEIKY